MKQSTKHEIPLYELLVRKISEVLQMTQAIVLVFLLGIDDPITKIS